MKSSNGNSQVNRHIHFRQQTSIPVAPDDAEFSNDKTLKVNTVSRDTDHIIRCNPHKNTSGHNNQQDPSLLYHTVDVGNVSYHTPLLQTEKANQTQATSPNNTTLTLNQNALVIDNLIKPFLTWCYQEAFNLTHKSSYQKAKETIALSSGVIIGGLSVASIYPLGGSFGSVLCDALGITDPSIKTTVYGFFAINALIPMLCLSCIEAKDLFTKLASSSNEKSITKENRKSLRRGFTCMAYVLAAFSAFSPMYATIDAFNDSPDWVKWLSVPASFIGPLIFKSASELRLIDRALNHFTPQEKYAINQMRKQLQTKLLFVVSSIKSMKDESLDQLFFQILQEGKDIQQEKQKQEEAYRHLRQIFSLNQGQDPNVSNSTSVVQPQKNTSCLSYFFKGTGFFMGVASAYVYYTLAESAAIYLCDHLGIENEETRQIIQTYTSSLAVIPWAALGAESTLAVFEKAYNFLNRKKYQQQNEQASSYWIPAISTIGGICSATPPTYLAIQALAGTPGYAKLLIIPAFLGPASIRAVAMSRLLEEGAAHIKSFKQQSAAESKEKLIEAVTKISSALHKLPDEQLSHLYFDFIKTYPAAFDLHTFTPGHAMRSSHAQKTSISLEEISDEPPKTASLRRSSF